MFSKLTNMSKKSEEFANNAYPNYSPDGKTQVDMLAYRFACAKGYEQAEKDTIKRAIEWWRPKLCGFLKEGLTEGVLGEFRKAMEEE